MRICVFGAGAIGGNFATRLAAAGNEVSIVARGAHLEAIRARGLTLLAGDKKIVAPVRASDRPADLGPQDAVLVTMKASGQHVLADSIGPLLGADTPVAFVQNGIPWWYGHGLSASRPPAGVPAPGRIAPADRATATSPIAGRARKARGSRSTWAGPNAPRRPSAGAAAR